MSATGYATPKPVTASDGTQTIWNWDTQAFEPYDPAKAAQARADIAARPAPNRTGEGPTPEELAGMTASYAPPSTLIGSPAKPTRHRVTLNQSGAGTSLLYGGR